MPKTLEFAKQTVLIPGDEKATIEFICETLIRTYQEAVEKKGLFSIALSGGSTPKKIFQKLSKEYTYKIDWTKVLLFWSDERGRPLTHKESNYHMAMVEGNLQSLPIPKEHIFPMKVEGSPKKQAKDYEELIRRGLGASLFDLVMLGVGEDGHTASIFPNTDALDEKKKLVMAHFVKEKNMWRMTLTLPCINASAKSLIVALGKTKANILKTLLSVKNSSLPAAKVGTPEKKSIWIVDNEASVLL